ncbi:phosphopyruvate hydratase [Candidatus Dojkabacteria bacterium]|nr:phosphopyruvate hydratase [Candidatus Dojkabacteria bacterium]
MKIRKVAARQIFDSRGTPTVEAEVFLEGGVFGRASVPSGASTGEHEAIELRDNDEDKFFGQGVLNAVQNVNDLIGRQILGMDAGDQEGIDEKMIEIDGTQNKSKLGANAILAVSMAVAVAEAKAEQKWLFDYLSKYNIWDKRSILPCPMFNVINGGKHAVGGVDFQEFMIMPLGAESFHEAFEMGVKTFSVLKQIFRDKGLPTLVGDEGGFAPRTEKNEDALKLIMQAIETAGYKPGKDIYIALDPAVSEIYEQGYYNLILENEKLDREGMISYWEEVVEKYPIISLEDPLDENDWEGWHEIMKKLGDKVQIVGDDLFVTNVERIKKGIEQGVANCSLIKLNQIGTVTETIRAIRLGVENSFTNVISHRSGETEDTFIADLSVAMATGQIKTGSFTRSERVAKYNQLLRIEEYLGDKAVFLGKNALNL